MLHSDSLCRGPFGALPRLTANRSPLTGHRSRFFSSPAPEAL